MLRARRGVAILRASNRDEWKTSGVVASTEGESRLNRNLLRAGLALAAVLGSLSFVSSARAAATVHRFNLELGAGATQVALDHFNEELDTTNRNLSALGLQGFDRMTFSFVYDVGFRYFLRPNVALRAGVGQLRSQTKREYLPAIGQDVQLRYEILSVPMQVGGDYYFAPYNQGDFQARGFIGVGVLSMVKNRVLFQSVARLGDQPSSRANTFLRSWQRDAPGWYGEGGVHMFFALRYSVVLNAYYRSAKMQNLVYTDTKQPTFNSGDGKPFELDLSGIGARASLCYGF